jgi:hypothetical protein
MREVVGPQKRNKKRCKCGLKMEPGTHITSFRKLILTETISGCVELTHGVNITNDPRVKAQWLTDSRLGNAQPLFQRAASGPENQGRSKDLRRAQ